MPVDPTQTTNAYSQEITTNINLRDDREVVARAFEDIAKRVREGFLPYSTDIDYLGLTTGRSSGGPAMRISMKRNVTKPF